MTITFGDWIKQRRRDLDLTQQQFADLVACSVITVQKPRRMCAAHRSRCSSDWPIAYCCLMMIVRLFCTLGEPSGAPPIACLLPRSRQRPMD